MPEQEIQGVKTAALLHDIGKLAVPEHILSKPGPLTQEEFQKIRIHPQVGAEIISAVPFPYPVAPLILSHHERWDGRGYPQGLKGEDIPLGARILSVVDYFDALTSDRPYHRAMDHEAALSLLEQESGKALDPKVVQMFFTQLPVLAGRGRPARAGAVAPAHARTHLRTRPPGRGLRERERQGQHGVRGHRARPPGDLRALRDRAVDGHEPRRGRHDGAHQLEAEQPGAVRRVRAVPLRRGARLAAVPLRHGPRLRAHRQHDHQERPRAHRLGHAQPPAARQRAAERRLRGRGPGAHGHLAQVGHRLAARVQRPPDRHARRLPGSRGRLHRRPPPAARPRVRAGLGRDQQRQRVRAHAGRLAHRRAHRAAEHALHVHPPVARAGARRAPEVGSGAARDGLRQLQGDQRHARAPRGRPRACARWPTCCAAACAPTTSACATPATSSSSCSRAAAPKRPSASASS